MFIKLNNKKIEKYPYSISELKKDNPQISFPNYPSEKLLAEWQVFPVVKTDQPIFDNITENISEGSPIFDGTIWKQVWIVTDASPEEIEQRTLQYNEIQKQNRSIAFQQEADSLFFKWQANEATEEEWQLKRQEIRNRFPYI